MKYILTILLILTTFAANARDSYTINSSWRFCLSDSQEAAAPSFDDSGWEIVSVPHTWNDVDAVDEVAGYHRGKGWYRKSLPMEVSEGMRYFIGFNGANQYTELFVNGKLAGTHTGGYSAFRFDITDLLISGDNALAVMVDNSHNPDIPPLSADFTFFGGIYRDVYLLCVPDTHISAEHYGSTGVYITTPEISGEKATVQLRTLLTNRSDKKQAVTVEHRVCGDDGITVATVKSKAVVAAGTANQPYEVALPIANPVLWDIDNPYLYKVYTTLYDKEGGELDMVVNPLGIRTYSFDTAEGFTLNGRSVKLMGTSRHQDYRGMGNALRDEYHVRDVKLLKEMGGNFLRISHYPQDRTISRMCDNLGLLTSVEIPVVNAVTLTDRFRENCMEMTREMVFQDFNSPSVIIWAYMNEVLLRPPYDPKSKAQKSKYFEFLYETVAAVDREIRSLDPARYTLLPCHGNANIYEESGITAIPDILAWNLYNGWYSGTVESFGKTLYNLHARFPDKVMMVSEYGADVDPRLHSFKPERFDFTCEFGMYYHEGYVKDILARKFVAAGMIWNLNDFQSEGRLDAVPRINNKGITGVDRSKKDTWYLYKTYLSQEPLVHIVGGDWRVRAGVENQQGVCVQPVKVYSNGQQVQLHLNGKSLGTKPINDNKAIFDVPFGAGENTLEAVAVCNGQTTGDMTVIDFDVIPASMAQFKGGSQMNVMFGSNRYFEDNPGGLCWIPEQEYVEGGWGYTGGYPAVTPTRHGALPASDVDVLGTDQDPVFQTQRRAIETFRADVPDGDYNIYFYWSELVSGFEKQALAYNLGNDAIAQEAKERVFDVVVNGRTVFPAVDLANMFGAERAVIEKTNIQVSGGEGIVIEFRPLKGEAVLNALRIMKNY